MKLGDTAETTGSNGKGRLEVTPTTIVYLTTASGDAPTNDLFAFITIKDRPTTATATRRAAPIEGGGWQWAAPDGQAIDAGDGESYNVVHDTFNSGGDIQPGTFKWDGIAFDLTKTQRGGTLIYTDGEGTAHRWAMPAKDSGPQTDDVRRGLR